jgi:putative oxidoreductase
MRVLERYGPVVARVLLAAIFLASGVVKLADPGTTAEHMASYGFPAFPPLAVAAGLVEVGGGALVLLGFRARWGALGLIALLVPATLIFHNPIGLDGTDAQMQTVHAMKNLAIIGGLLAVAAFGSGAFSLDSVVARRVNRGPRAERCG